MFFPVLHGFAGATACAYPFITAKSKHIYCAAIAAAGAAEASWMPEDAAPSKPEIAQTSASRSQIFLGSSEQHVDMTAIQIAVGERRIRRELANGTSAFLSSGISAFGCLWQALSPSTLL